MTETTEPAPHSEDKNQDEQAGHLDSKKSSSEQAKMREREMEESGEENAA